MRGLVVALLVSVALAGCFGGSDEADVEEPAPPVDVKSLPPAQRPVDTNKTVIEYLHDLPEPIPGVSSRTATMVHLRTPIDELIELDTWIAVPNIDEPVGTVLEVTPYYGGGDPRFVQDLTEPGVAPFNRVADELITRGFAVGISSVRGTGNSGGCFTQGGPDEARDTAAVIEHVAQQPWSNGNVGMMGVSYPGTTPNDAWVEAPPALKAVVPISGISDMYKYNFVNGVPINVQGFGFNTYYWAIVGAGPAGLSGGAQALDPEHVATAAAGEACTDQVDVQEGGVSSTADGNKDAYWQVRDFHAEAVADADKHRPAVFYIHGLQDWNVKPHNMEDWLPMLQASGAEYKVWLGQWGHAWPQGGDCVSGDPVRGPGCRNDWWSHGVVAWFDQFLNDNDNGILDAPRVQVQDDTGRWRHEQVWPPLDVTWHKFGLGGDKLITGDGTGASTYYDNQGGNVPTDEATSVSWTSEPLPFEWTISGQPVFRANVTADGNRASLILALQEVLPDGSTRTFSSCAQSLNHVQSLAAGAESIAGVRQEVEFRCFPQDDVIRESSRLRIVAGGMPMGSASLQPVSDGGFVTIEHAGASFSVPVDHSLVYEWPQPYDAPDA